MEFFLGVDCGATKNSATVLDSRGKIAFQKTGKGSIFKIDKDFIKRLHEFVSPVIKKYKISSACFGVAGVDSEKDYRIAYRTIKKKFRLKKIKVLNDVEIILPVVTSGPGVAVIAGTGSKFFATDHKRTAYASGMGHILSDEGGAYDMGVRILRAAVRSADGRGEKTVLEKLVMNKAGIKKMSELNDVIYKKFDKALIASFAPLADMAAKKWDYVAKQILKDAANEIITGIAAVAIRAGIEKDKINVVMIGGVFKSKVILNRVKKGVLRYMPGARIRIIEDSSLGAARIAMKK